MLWEPLLGLLFVAFDGLVRWVEVFIKFYDDEEEMVIDGKRDKE